MSWLSKITGVDINILKSGLDQAFGTAQGDALYATVESKDPWQVAKWAITKIWGTDKGTLIYSFISGLSTAPTESSQLEIIQLAFKQFLGDTNGTALYTKYESEIKSALESYNASKTN